MLRHRASLRNVRRHPTRGISSLGSSRRPSVKVLNLLSIVNANSYPQAPAKCLRPSSLSPGEGDDLYGWLPKSMPFALSSSIEAGTQQARRCIGPVRCLTDAAGYDKNRNENLYVRKMGHTNSMKSPSPSSNVRSTALPGNGYLVSIALLHCSTGTV